MKWLCAAVIMLAGCSSRTPDNEINHDLSSRTSDNGITQDLTLDWAYSHLMSAETFAVVCGDGSPFTDEGIAMYMVMNINHKDRIKRMSEVARFGTTEGQLFALTALHELDRATFEETLGELELAGQYTFCGGCLVYERSVAETVAAIGRGELSRMISGIDILMKLRYPTPQ